MKVAGRVRNMISGSRPAERRQAARGRRSVGADAGELMTAWSIASFINEVAKAGKAVYDIPMFVKCGVWNNPGG